MLTGYSRSSITDLHVVISVAPALVASFSSHCPVRRRPPSGFFPHALRSLLLVTLIQSRAASACLCRVDYCRWLHRGPLWPEILASCHNRQHNHQYRIKCAILDLERVLPLPLPLTVQSLLEHDRFEKCCWNGKYILVPIYRIQINSLACGTRGNWGFDNSFFGILRVQCTSLAFKECLVVDFDKNISHQLG